MLRILVLEVVHNMKDIYELLNDIDIDENEFEEMEVSEIEKEK